MRDSIEHDEVNDEVTQLLLESSGKLSGNGDDVLYLGFLIVAF